MKLQELFQLNDDTDRAATIEQITSGIEFKGPNIWALIIAMLIASIGLNVNSTAVIIGAMLISPLMGPIMGAGMALALYDTALLKRSLVNLGIMTGVSLAASALYFSLTPLSTSGSELLARTSPSFYDVLIAFLGGSAMIISISRKNRMTNAIAGVAIATALMPPLCTAGYGLAVRNAGFFAGAFYLYLINSVFIGTATFLFTKYLKLARVREEAAPKFDRNHILLMILAAVLFLAPSLYIGWDMVQETTFHANVDRFVDEGFRFPDTRVLKVEKSRRESPARIEVTLVGQLVDQHTLDNMAGYLPRYGLQGVELRIVQSNGTLSALRPAAAEPQAQASQPPVPERNAEPLAQPIITPPPAVASSKVATLLSLERELPLLFPAMRGLAWGDLLAEPAAPMVRGRTYRIFVRWDSGATQADKARLASFVRIRLGHEGIETVE